MLQYGILPFKSSPNEVKLFAKKIIYFYLKEFLQLLTGIFRQEVKFVVFKTFLNIYWKWPTGTSLVKLSRKWATDKDEKSLSKWLLNDSHEASPAAGN